MYCCQNLLFTFLAMCETSGKHLLRFGNCLSMRRNDLDTLKILDTFERMDIILQIAFWWKRDNARTTALNQITSKENMLLFQPEAEVIGTVPRCVYRTEHVVTYWEECMICNLFICERHFLVAECQNRNFQLGT